MRIRTAMFFGIFVLMALAGMFIALSLQHLRVEQELTRSSEQLIESMQLASQLRQSSDDLTRMARLYAATSDVRYKEYFLRILAIRNGESPRPENYGGIFWDRVLANPGLLDDSGEAIALRTLMRRAGFTDEEFALLKEAEDNSNELVNLEEVAMNAMVGRFADGEGGFTRTGPPDPDLARSLMFGERYHAAKHRIMTPIDEFRDRIQQRLKGRMDALHGDSLAIARWQATVAVISMAVLLCSLYYARSAILNPLRGLVAGATALRDQNYATRISVRGGQEIIQLSRTFNHMAEAIESDIARREQTARELREANEAAHAASQAKSDFLANMSHEIRTPMNSIMGMTELVLDTSLTPSQKEYLTIAYESAESLLSVINEILDFSKIEAGKLELTSDDIDLRDEVGNIMRSLAWRAHSKGLELVWRVQPEVPRYFRADSVRLRQVLVNLTGNAIKFTTDGEVALEVNLDGMDGNDAIMRFIVSDTGIGISEARLNTIFKAFEQADSTTTRQFGGTGLGLAITQRIVEAMGGRIWVESEPGEGSNFNFTVKLPVGEEPPDTAPLQDLDLVQVPVVVVDDNATNCRILKEMLESWNMTVTVTSDGPGAIEALRRSLETDGRLPLLISDVNMPEMDGFMLAEELRSSEDLRSTLILLLTSGGRAGDITRCEQLGVNAHLMKPVKQSELQEAIIRVVGRVPHAPARKDPVDEASVVIRPLNILLAEDGRANQILAIALLKKWGHSIIVAENGQQAIDLWAAGKFDLILMDVQMPVMDGLTATRRIREREQPPTRIPIIAMTARAMKGDRESCLESGMDAFVPKPMKRQALYDALVPFFAEESAASKSEPSDAELIDWETALAGVENDESILEEVVKSALDETAQLACELESALTAGDAGGVQRHAHTIKSTSKYYGATTLTECVETIETAASDNNLAEVQLANQRFQQLCRQFLDELHDHLRS